MLFRSDAESVTTTISQDSHGSNKENLMNRDSANLGEDEEVELRRKPEYTRVSLLFNFEPLQLHNN